MYLQKICKNGQKGAITVFLSLIFMSVIIFAGTVIDIVRIAAADRKIQSVLNSSARSVLAGYDSELAGSYGIYGINTEADTVEDDFYRYLSVNLKERHKGISFIDIKIDRKDIGIKGLESLLKDEVFKRQVQEYMKYRVPIYGALGLVEQFKNFKLEEKVDFAKSEKVTRDKAMELRTKAKEVNSKLAVIKDKIVDLSAGKLDELKNELTEALTISGSIYTENGQGLLDEYNKSLEDANNKADKVESVQNQSQEFEAIEENSQNLKPELQGYLAEVNKTIQKVKPIQKELKSLEEELASLEDDIDDLEEELLENEEDESSAESRDEITDKITEVKESIEELESKIDNEISDLKEKLYGFSLEGYSMKDESVQLSDRKDEELKKSINRIKEEIEDALLKKLKEEWLISAKEFDGSNFIIGEDFGIIDEGAHYSSSMKESEAEESNNKILRSMEKLAEAVKEAASTAAEKINTIEYVMDKYTFLTSKTERGHYFRKGEVEYIISGADTGEAYTSLKNTEYYVVTNVLLQVWALRFAIDFIDNFVRSVIVFPPQRLSVALVEGALDSSMDIFKMLNGEEIPICPKSFTAFRMKYSDHLKILLLMKPEEEILRKARQLMQVNIKQLVDTKTGNVRTDFRLGDYKTVISASVKAKVNLWFLPVLKVDRLMPGSFEEGRYIIRKQVFAGY